MDCGSRRPRTAGPDRRFQPADIGERETDARREIRDGINNRKREMTHRSTEDSPPRNLAGIGIGQGVRLILIVHPLSRSVKKS